MMEVKKKLRKISPRREYIQIQRIVTSYERNLSTKLLATFNNIYKNIGREYADTGKYPAIDFINEKINQALLPFYRSIINEFSLRTSKSVEAKDSFRDLLINRWIRDFGSKNITDISRTTRTNINKIIQNGITEGLSINNTAKLISESGDSLFNKMRAKTIARTETHQALNYANIETARKLPLPNIKKQWMSALDDRTREWHKAMNGVQVGIDEKFNVAYNGITYKMDRPLDPAGGAANVVNCRCVLLFITDEDVIS